MLEKHEDLGQSRKSDRLNGNIFPCEEVSHVDI